MIRDDDFLEVIRDFEERIASDPEYWAQLHEDNMRECRKRYESRTDNRDLTLEESGNIIRDILESVRNDTDEE